MKRHEELPTFLEEHSSSPKTERWEKLPILNANVVAYSTLPSIVLVM